MNKKILSLITTVCVSANFVLIPNINTAAQAFSFPVSYNFESDSQGWQLDTSKGDASLERLTEEENSFLRLTAKSGEVYRANDKIEIIPNGYIEQAVAYEMSPYSEVVISLDMRTNTNKFVRNIYLNRNLLNEEVKSEVQYNFTTLWNWKKDNSVSVFDGVSTQSVGGYQKTKSTTMFDTEFENDKWYNIKTVLFTDAEGLPEFIQLSISDNGDVNLISEKKGNKKSDLEIEQ